MNTERIRDGFMPWAGLAFGTAGYFFAHQLGSDSTFQDCRVASPWIVILAMLVGLAVIGLGALGSLGVFASRGESPARRLVAAVSLGASTFFAIGVTLPFIAALLIPGCWA